MPCCLPPHAWCAPPFPPPCTATRRFTRKLKKVTAEQGARFVSYDAASGTWKFEVEHFSKYGLLDSDDEDEGEGEAGAGAGGAGGAGSDEELQQYGVRGAGAGGSRPGQQQGQGPLGWDEEQAAYAAGEGEEDGEAMGMQDSKLAAASAGQAAAALQRRECSVAR